MKLEKVLDGVNSWKRDKDNYNSLEKHLEKVTHFDVQFEDIETNHKTEFIHVYFGVESGKLFTYNLLDYRDTLKQHKANEGIGPHIIKGTLESISSIDPIDDKIALERIKTWKQHRKEWLKDQTSHKKELLVCFVVPTISLKNHQPYRAHLALKKGKEETINSRKLDLILQDLESGVIIRSDASFGFHDVSRLVPPFENDKNPSKHGELKKELFFIHNLANES